MSIQNDHRISQSQTETRDDVDAWADQGSDFVLIAEGKPPPRIELARERLLICRLYLGLLQTITDDYGTEFASHSDSLAYRTIGIYVFLRTVMCSPVRASQIAHALKLPRVSVVRRLDELIKHGYVEHVGNAYRVTDKVNIPDLQKKLQRRIDMVAETAKRLAEAGGSAR
jgi:DNA-binding MarR family transcriptional regulator